MINRDHMIYIRLSYFYFNFSFLTFQYYYFYHFHLSLIKYIFSLIMKIIDFASVKQVSTLYVGLNSALWGKNSKLWTIALEVLDTEVCREAEVFHPWERGAERPGPFEHHQNIRLQLRTHDLHAVDSSWVMCAKHEALHQERLTTNRAILTEMSTIQASSTESWSLCTFWLVFVRWLATT